MTGGAPFASRRPLSPADEACAGRDPVALARVLATSPDPTGSLRRALVKACADVAHDRLVRDRAEEHGDPSAGPRAVAVYRRELTLAIDAARSWAAGAADAAAKLAGARLDPERVYAVAWRRSEVAFPFQHRGLAALEAVAWLLALVDVAGDELPAVVASLVATIAASERCLTSRVRADLGERIAAGVPRPPAAA